jgi:hypothetical protein
MKIQKWLLALARAGASVTPVTTLTTCVPRTMCVSPLIVVSSGSEVRNARRKKNQRIVRYRCLMCPKKTTVIPVCPSPARKQGAVMLDEICYECKIKIRDDFRVENTRARGACTPTLPTFNKIGYKNKKTVFLAVGMFSIRPEVHNICVSIHHQLLCAGSVCKQTHCE